MIPVTVLGSGLSDIAVAKTCLFEDRPSFLQNIQLPPEYMKNTLFVRFVEVAAGLALLVGLAGPLYAQGKLKAVAVTVGDLGNPFFVQIAHGAQAEAKKINPSVKFSAESSNY